MLCASVLGSSMDEREELQALRRLAELEAKAGDRQSASVPQAVPVVAPQPAPKKESAPDMWQAKMLRDAAAGAIRGAGSIGATFIRPFESAEENAQRRAAMDEGLAALTGADTEALAFGGGKLGGEIAGTAGVGTVLAAPLRAFGALRASPVAQRIAQSLQTAGFKTGVGGGAIGNTAIRVGGGAGAGGAAAGMVNPEDAAFGAIVGGAIGPVVHAGASVAKPVSEWAWNSIARPIGDMFTKEGPAHILRKHVVDKLGEQNVAATINAAKNATAAKAGPGMYPVKYTPTMAEAVYGLPEGSPIAAMQNSVSRMPGGPSVTFGKVEEARDAAIRAAEGVRDSTAAPLRQLALENANLAGTVGSKLEQKQAVLEKIAADRTQDVRRFSAAADRAGGRAHYGEPQGQAAKTIVPGYPRQPGKYTYMGELEGAAEKTAGKAADASLKVGEAARFNKYQLDSLAQHGYYPLTSDKISASINRLRSNPGDKANTTLQKALAEINDTLKSVTDKTGIVDARELYTIRKLEIGNVIEKYAKDNASWDKRRTAGLIKDVQRAIDDAIESSGGTGWKDYLREYSGRSKSIDAVKERAEGMYKPRQKTNIGETNVVDDVEPPRFQALSRLATMANYGLKAAGRNVEPKVNALAAQIFTDPDAYVRTMSAIRQPFKFKEADETILRQLARIGAPVAVTD